MIRFAVLIVFWGISIFLIFYGLGMLLAHQRIRNVFKDHKKYKQDEVRKGYPNYSIFIVISLCLGLTGVLVSLKYLKNYMAAFPLGVGFALLPWGYFNYRKQKKGRLLEQQLVTAIQYFVSAYNTYPNIMVSLKQIVPRVGYPLSEEIKRLIRELNSGRCAEEALFDFAKNINSSWAYRFAHILNLRMKRGININIMLYDLYMEIKTRVVKEKQLRSEAAGVRLECYLLYLFIPFIYFMTVKISPQSHQLLTNTPAGQKVILLIIILVVIGLAITIRSDNKMVKRD